MTASSVPRGLPIGLGSGGEFDRIRAILGAGRGGTDAGAPVELSVGPGDDAAVLDDLVLSTDLTVEDVHFRREWIGLEELGHRAVSVALSDLGAMGARPVLVLWSLALADTGIDVARRLGEGAREAAGAAGAVLAGGDLSRSPGPLFIDVVVVGRTSSPVLRSTARPGDDLWVSGTLGGAAAAVSVWTGGATPPEALRRRYVRPDPPLGLLAELRSQGLVSAGIDVSDGLLADAGHLSAASGVGIRIVEDRVPVDPGLGGLPPARGLGLALTGGEDYQVLFSAPRAARQALQERGAGPVPLHRIGGVVPGAGVVRITPAGTEHPVTGGGFDHFGGERP